MEFALCPMFWYYMNLFQSNVPQIDILNMQYRAPVSHCKFVLVYFYILIVIFMWVYFKQQPSRTCKRSNRITCFFFIKWRWGILRAYPQILLGHTFRLNFNSFTRCWYKWIYFDVNRVMVVATSIQMLLDQIWRILPLVALRPLWK